MKKVLLSILLTLLPLLASAETVEIDGIWYNLVAKAQEAEVTQNPNKYKGDVEIPASVTYNDIKYNVASIGSEAFKSCYGLISVTIPNSVISIGSYAFYWSTSLKSINIPTSVTIIGSHAFENCSSLQSVTIPNSLSEIGNSVFFGCRSLTSITIPPSVTFIYSDAFYGCSDLTSVKILDLSKWCKIKFGNAGSNPLSNAHHLFLNGSEVKELIIPSDITGIEKNAFYGCTGLTSITISNNVTSIGGWAFQDCTSLTSVTIGTNVTSIENHAFANCDELTDVFCLADQVSNTNIDAFKDSYPQGMTLHVPAASIEAYSSTEPWSQFKTIVALEDGDTPEIKKCATPEISYANGKVSLSCETEGVEFISEVTVDDAKNYYDSEFALSQTYKITVYATKAGYENSDVATREIVIENGQTALFGDLNKDGKVNVADHVKLSDIIMNK